MFLLYDSVFLVYALFYLPYLVLTGRWYDGFEARFGILTPQVKKKLKQGPNIWLHAVSVGEVMVLDSFIDRLRAQYPGHQLVVTVTTKTGYALAFERLWAKAMVLPSPVDLSFVARRFMVLIAPTMYIAVETEIWPNLFAQLYRWKVPIVVINGRISDASFGRYKAIRFLLKRILNQVSVWCMQSKQDAEKIKELGAEPGRVSVTGNIKFDELPQSSAAHVHDLLKGKEELWWIAGSTHAGEEEIVLDVYGKLIKENFKWRLLIAPRHIERVSGIMELVERRGLKAVRFSGNGHSVFPDVVVLDTIGHLRSLYPLASLVFVGKSLCVGGGHNVIEPAFHGKAVIVGPRVENFRDIIACFKEGQGIMQVEDARALEAAVLLLCADDGQRQALGVAARKVIAANQGAGRRCLEHLKGLLE